MEEAVKTLNDRVFYDPGVVQPIIDDKSPTDDLPRDIPLGEIETTVREYEDMRDAEANAAAEAEET